MKRIIFCVFIAVAFEDCTSAAQTDKSNQAATDMTSVDSKSDNMPVEPEIVMPKLNIDDFELDYFKEVAKSFGNNNFTTSPTSTTFALAMIANISDSIQQNRILEALKFDSLTQLNKSSLNDLNWFAKDSTEAKILIGNSLWLADNRHIKLDSKHKALQKYLKAIVEDVDFSNPQTFDIIAKWGYDATNGNIIPHISAINSDRAIMVLNLIYYKGRWRYPFKETNTNQQKFYGTNRECEVNMMMKNFLESYYIADNFQAVTMDLEDGSSLILLLPNKGLTPTDVLETFNSSTLNSIIKESKTVDMKLSLPKFEINTQQTIMEPLEQLGISILSTQFKDIGIEHLNDISMNQLAKIKIDESGAQASAETAMIGTISIEDDKPVYEYIEITFDRPFIFILRNKKTKSLIMSGIYAGPEE